jgi:hypothetical protein
MEALGKHLQLPLLSIRVSDWRFAPHPVVGNQILARHKLLTFLGSYQGTAKCLFLHQTLCKVDRKIQKCHPFGLKILKKPPQTYFE